jgi:predicted AlkP superfamily phosphohydrolase/phosphomutase
MDDGVWGRLESTIPPITVPAWTSMMTGKDPGQLGFYGFKNRTNYSYKELGFANSTAIKNETVWDLLSKHAKYAAF